MFSWISAFNSTCFMNIHLNIHGCPCMDLLWILDPRLATTQILRCLMPHFSAGVIVAKIKRHLAIFGFGNVYCTKARWNGTQEMWNSTVKVYKVPVCLGARVLPLAAIPAGKLTFDIRYYDAYIIKKSSTQSTYRSVWLYDMMDLSLFDHYVAQ